MITKEVGGREISEDTALNAMWRAYCRASSTKVEEPNKVSRGVPSPFWGPNFGNHFTISNSGAGEGQHIFTGYDFDEEVNLHYAGARYYDQDVGRFLSIDPVMQNLVIDERTEQVLADPQLQNSYSYARNNPLKYTDPTGEAIPLLPILAVYSAIQLGIDAYDAKTTLIDYPEVFSSQDKYQSGFKLGLDLLFFGAGKATKDIGERAVLEVGPVQYLISWTISLHQMYMKTPTIKPSPRILLLPR